MWPLCAAQSLRRHPKDRECGASGRQPDGAAGASGATAHRCEDLPTPPALIRTGANLEAAARLPPRPSDPASGRRPAWIASDSAPPPRGQCPLSRQDRATGIPLVPDRERQYGPSQRGGGTACIPCLNGWLAQVSRNAADGNFVWADRSNLPAIPARTRSADRSAQR